MIKELWIYRKWLITYCSIDGECNFIQSWLASDSSLNKDLNVDFTDFTCLKPRSHSEEDPKMIEKIIYLVP